MTRDPNAPMSGAETRETRLFVLFATFMIALAFLAGQRATHDLTWAPYVDMDRDASFAQSILDGHYGEDPLYLGGSMWFTPMYFTLEAAMASISGLSIQRIQATTGAYLNLLAPIAFFLMAWRFFGPRVALVALMAYLFLAPGQEPGYAVATYSPWSIPVSFFQGLFYLMMIVLHRVFRSTSVAAWSLGGAAVGLLFIGHAAPAMITVAIIAVRVVRSLFTSWRAGDRTAIRKQIVLAGAAAVAFIVISLPLTWYVVGDYGLDQRNRVPASYTYIPLSLRHWNLFLFHNISWYNAFGIAGMIMVFRGNASIQRRILLTWAGVAMFLGVFAYAAVILGEFTRIRLPMSVPTFHFYSYLKGALALGAGVALVHLVQWAARAATRDRTGPAGALSTSHVIMGITTLVTVATYPTYSHRPDLEVIRQFSLTRMADKDATDMYVHLRDALPWDAVVLCDDELSMWVLMASARKTVATNASMANPYVPPAPREAAREAMLAALADPTVNVSGPLAMYQVKYLLVRTTDVDRMQARSRWFPRRVYGNRGYVLFSR